jgi:hypothetical protein
VTGRAPPHSLAVTSKAVPRPTDGDLRFLRPILVELSAELAERAENALAELLAEATGRAEGPVS